MSLTVALLLTVVVASSPDLLEQAPESGERSTSDSPDDGDAPKRSQPDPDPEPTPQWIAAWGASPEVRHVAAADSSVRNIARISVTGTEVRVRIANPRENEPPLNVGSATVALQLGSVGADVVPGTMTELTFDGRPGIVVAPGTDAVYSDPVDFPVVANENLAVTLYLPQSVNPDVGGGQWNTSYATAAGAGDKSGETAGSVFTTTSDATYALTAVDVLSTDANGAVIGFGSSTLHGSNSTRDGYDRVLDLLITRIQDEVPAGNRKGIVGAGHGGDTLHDAVRRLDRDALSQSGVSDIVVWATNDLASRTAEQIIEDYETVIKRSHAGGVQVFCPTWMPAAQSLGARDDLTQLNQWISTSGRCDGTVDWDRTVRDETDRSAFAPEFYSDGIHPNAAGHAALSAATPLRWFAGPATSVNYPSGRLTAALSSIR